jgi:hypothetical protein
MSIVAQVAGSGTPIKLIVSKPFPERTPASPVPFVKENGNRYELPPIAAPSGAVPPV